MLPDLVLSGSAAIGLLIVRSQIAPSTDGVTWRFRAMLLTTALFYLVRAIEWLSGLGLFRILTFALAAMIPFVALLLAEGMLRRHAPRALKIAAVLAMVALVLASVIAPLTREPAFLTLFLIYQLGLFAASFGLLLLRDRSSLSHPENRLADRVLLTGPVLLLLLASDYVMPNVFGLPALSALGALVLAWVASTFEARAASGAFTATAVAAVFALSGVAAAALGLRHGWTGVLMIEAAVVLAAMILTLLVFLSSAVLRRARARASLRAALDQQQSLPEFLDAIAAHGLTEGFDILGPKDLHDFDTGRLIDALGPRGSGGRSALAKSATDDTLTQSQLRALLDRFAAQQAILVSTAPLRLAVGTPNRLAEGAGSDTEAAFAIARLIGERDAAKDPSP